jgi:hypothetical protein
MSYFEEKTHEEIIEDILDNKKEGYDFTLPILNYANYLFHKKSNPDLTMQDWLDRINLEIYLNSEQE